MRDVAGRCGQVRFRVGVVARADAPDRHRPRGDRAARGRRGLPRCRGGLHRRRVQLCRHRAPLAWAAAPWRGAQIGDAVLGGRARSVPVVNERQILLRFWRHGEDDAAHQEPHARRLVHAAVLAFGGPQVPCNGAPDLPHQGVGLVGSAGGQAIRRFRRRAHLLQSRGHPPCAGSDARHRRRYGRGPGGQREGRSQGNIVQHVRPRALRYARMDQVRCGRNRRL
mmetsp:Transcript_85538/g.261590  ORF Transcript_85538/g.261590 Transcript_85538/m.261590 type:complete len:224 (-) Transcript_85538:109-780(-)